MTESEDKLSGVVRRLQAQRSEVLSLSSESEDKLAGLEFRQKCGAKIAEAIHSMYKSITTPSTLGQITCVDFLHVLPGHGLKCRVFIGTPEYLDKVVKAVNDMKDEESEEDAPSGALSKGF